jgi:hypothetical protein
MYLMQAVPSNISQPVIQDPWERKTSLIKHGKLSAPFGCAKHITPVGAIFPEAFH